MVILSKNYSTLKQCLTFFFKVTGFISSSMKSFLEVIKENFRMFNIYIYFYIFSMNI